MRILMVTDELPAFPGYGGATRTFCLLRELSHRHEVALLLVARHGTAAEMDAAVPILRRFCCRVEVARAPATKPRGVADLDESEAARPWTWSDYLRGVGRMIAAPAEPLQERQALVSLVQTKVWEIGQQWPHDVIQAEHSWAGSWLAGFPTPAVKALTFHNLLWLLTESRLRTAAGLKAKLWLWFERRKLFQYEREIATRFDLSLTMSQIDGDRLQAAAPRARVAVVPNGVDTGYFQPAAQTADQATAVFTGTLAYPPNTDGVQYFHRDILPLVRAQRPDASFLAVGMNPPADLLQLNQTEGVTIVGAVPDIRPYIERGAICVVPLRMGSGTRLKILEAMAMGKPVVSTAIGCEGLDVTAGENILIADDAAGFAMAVIRLIQDAALRERLGRAGRRLVERSYSWEAIARLQEAAYAQVVSIPSKRL